MSDPGHLSVNRINPSNQPTKLAASAQLQKLGATQLTSIPTPQSSMEMLDSTFNPLAMARRFIPLNDRMRRQQAKPEEQKEAEKQELEAETQVQGVQEVDKAAQDFAKRNPEFKNKDLQHLRERLRGNDSSEDILRKVLDAYPDFTLADEALDFLLQTTEGSLHAAVQGAKDELNSRYQREIVAGKNISGEVQDFSKQGLGTPTQLRDIYRDITGNPRDAMTLFEELSTSYSFDKLQPLVAFLLQSLGTDLKAKGPSIARAELHRLFTDTRSLQAILGIYYFFKARMRIIFKSFERHGIKFSGKLNFETLAKQFIKLLQERYPTIEKALRMALEFGITQDLIAQIIVFSQMRDGVRQVAPKLFRSEQHRQDILTTYLQLIEELDEQLEEEEEKEAKDE